MAPHAVHATSRSESGPSLADEELPAAPARAAKLPLMGTSFTTDTVRSIVHLFPPLTLVANPRPQRPGERPLGSRIEVDFLLQVPVLTTEQLLRGQSFPLSKEDQKALHRRGALLWSQLENRFANLTRNIRYELEGESKKPFNREQLEMRPIAATSGLIVFESFIHLHAALFCINAFRREQERLFQAAFETGRVEPSGPTKDILDRALTSVTPIDTPLIRLVSGCRLDRSASSQFPEHRGPERGNLVFLALESLRGVTNDRMTTEIAAAAVKEACRLTCGGDSPEARAFIRHLLFRSPDTDLLIDGVTFDAPKTTGPLEKESGGGRIPNRTATVTEEFPPLTFLSGPGRQAAFHDHLVPMEGIEHCFDGRLQAIVSGEAFRDRHTSYRPFDAARDTVQSIFTPLITAVWRHRRVSAYCRHTAPPELEGYRLADAREKVVFEGFGHMLSAVSCLHAIIRRAEDQALGKAPLPVHRAVMKRSPQSVLRSAIDDKPDRWARAEARFGKSYLVLASLALPGAAHDLPPTVALRSLHEACIESCGEISVRALRFIQGLTFMGRSGRLSFTGDGLMRRTGARHFEELVERLGGSTARTPRDNSDLTPIGNPEPALPDSIAVHSPPHILNSLSGIVSMADVDVTAALRALTEACRAQSAAVESRSLQSVRERRFTDPGGSLVCTGEDLLDRSTIFASQRAPSKGTNDPCAREAFPTLARLTEPHRLARPDERHAASYSAGTLAHPHPKLKGFRTAEEILQRMRNRRNPPQSAREFEYEFRGYLKMRDEDLQHLRDAAGDAVNAAHRENREEESPVERLRDVLPMAVTTRAGDPEVVFENFGHLVTTYREAFEFYRLNVARLAESLKIDRPVDDTGAISLHAALQQLFPHWPLTWDKAASAKIDRLYRIGNDGAPTVDYILTTLRGTIDGPEGSLHALREACLQRRGEVSLAALREVDGLRYTSFEARRVLPGSTLIEAAGIDRALLKPLQSLPLQTAITAAPSGGRMTVAVNEPQERAEEQQRNDIYRELFEDLDVPVGTLFLALCALGEERESPRSFHSFNGRIKTSIAESRERQGRAAAPLTPIALFDRILALHRPRHADLTTVGRERLADLLKQLSYRLYDGSHERMLAELRTFSEGHSADSPLGEFTREVLKDVVPLVIKRIERVTQFRDPPGLTFVPFDFQRETVAAAVNDDKWLAILGPGTGKTETGVLLAEHLISTEQCAGAFWATKPGVRADTARRLRELLPAGRVVLELTGDLAEESPGDFAKRLAGCHYLVAGYDTVRVYAQKYPDHFKEIRAFVARSVKLLDEAHVLDNPNSKRCQALRQLRSEKTAVLTATPVQHRRERVATLVHLAMPDRYPDPEVLLAHCAADKKFARALLLTHATIYGIADVAKVFTPFGKDPPERQLSSGIPRIPRLTVERRTYHLSFEHSLLYVELATNYDAWAEANGWPKGPLSQLLALRKLISDPEALGAAPPYALRSAVKEQMIPVLDSGRKALCLGQFLPVLKFVAGDTELQSRGSALVTGQLSSERRAALFRKLEDDPELGSIIGQTQAAGTGYNARSVTHLTFLPDPTNLTSEIVQGIGRPRRILTLRDKRYANETLTVTFLQPELAPEALELVHEPERRAYLEKGTVYEEWLTRALGRLQDYTDFFARSVGGAARSRDEESLHALLESLSEVREKLKVERAQYELLNREHLAKYFFRYRAPSKVGWRVKDLGSTLDLWLPRLAESPNQLQVACLPGPEALEVPIYAERSIPPGNIMVFEDDADPAVRRHCRTVTRKAGCEFYESPMEAVLPYHPRVLHVASVDTDGYMKAALAELFLDLNLAPRAAVLINRLCAREQAKDKILLAAAGGARDILDLELAALAGSRRLGHLDIPQAADAVAFSLRLRALTASLADQLAEQTNRPAGWFVNAIDRCARPWGIVTDKKQFTYQTPGGSRFLSTFVLLDRSFAEKTAPPWASALGDQLRRSARNAASSRDSARSLPHFQSAVRCSATTARFMLGIPGEPAVDVPLSAFRALKTEPDPRNTPQGGTSGGALRGRKSAAR